MGDFSFDWSNFYQTLCFHSGLCSGLCGGLWAGSGRALFGLCVGQPAAPQHSSQDAVLKHLQLSTLGTRDLTIFVCFVF